MASLQVLNYYLTLGSSDPIFIQQHIRKHRLNQSLIPMYPTTSELTERFKRVYLEEGTGRPSAGASTLFKDVQNADQVTVFNGEGDAPETISQLYTRVIGPNGFSGNNLFLNQDISDADKALKQKLQVLRDIMFVEDFNKKWAFMGVILTDMDLNSRYQKLFNLNVRGRSRIFNVWNSKSAATNSMHGRRDNVQKGDELISLYEKLLKTFRQRT